MSSEEHITLKEMKELGIKGPNGWCARRNISSIGRGRYPKLAVVARFTQDAARRAADNAPCQVRCKGCKCWFQLPKLTSMQVYCTPACKDEHVVKRQTFFTCAFCKRDFTKHVPLSQPAPIYCGKDCSNHAIQDTFKRFFNRSPELKSTCSVCGSPFNQPIESKTISSICSTACATEAEKMTFDKG